MSNFPGFTAAQREYDNRTPPEDGPCECVECDATGDLTRPDGEWLGKCPICEGFGMVTANGEPFDPDAAENAACDYADRQRDEQLTRSDE